MNEDLFVSKKVMDTGYKVVICYKGMVFTSNKNEIDSILEFIDSKLDLSMYALSCNSLGLAVANLCLALKIKFIYAYEISEDALILLNNNGVKVLFESKKNRENMPYINLDELVIDIDINSAVKVIRDNK